MSRAFSVGKQAVKKLARPSGCPASYLRQTSRRHGAEQEAVLCAQFGGEVIERNGIGNDLKRQTNEVSRRSHTQGERETWACNNLDNTGSWFCGENAVGAHEHIHAGFSPNAREPRHQLQHQGSDT
jgi:hypothetical protein